MKKTKEKEEEDGNDDTEKRNILSMTSLVYPEQCAAEKANKVSFLELMFNTLPQVLIVVCAIAVICNLFLFILLSRGVYLRKLLSKRLLFVANRCISDLITAIISLLYLSCVRITCDMVDCESTSIFPDHFMQLVVTLNYWVLATSYFGISVLTCYAVRLPLRYKLGLSMGRVTRAIAFGWIIMISILGFAFKAGQQPLFDSNGMLYMMRHRYHGLMDHWMVELCVNIINNSLVKMGFISLLLPILSYFMTIASYGFVIVMLFRRRNNHYVSNRHQASVWRLGVHISVFTFSFILMGLAYWATHPMAESCNIWSKKLTEMEHKRKLERNKLMECDLEYLSAFFYYGTFTSLSAVGWFTRMTLDPIIDLLTDKQLRELMIFREKRQFHERTATFILLDRQHSAARSSQQKYSIETQA